MGRRPHQWTARGPDEGFTLIELLVVIIIIGILAAIAIPVFLNQRDKGYDAAVRSDLHNVGLAEEAYLTDNGVYVAGNVNWSMNPLSTEQARISPPQDYSGTTGIVLEVFKTVSGTATGGSGTTGTVGFCLYATSSSGRTWEYNSTAGGLDPNPVTSTTCPYGAWG